MSKFYKFSFLIICSILLIGCVSQEPVLSDFKDKKPQEIYITAERDFGNRYYNKAIRDFRGLIQFYQFNDYTERAYIKLINCYIKVEQFVDAAKTANEFARLYPHSSCLKEIRYLQRKVLEEAYITAERDFGNGYYNKAIRDFRGLIQFYQFNDYTERAYIKLINCYIKVEQFVDAAKTANEFVRLYPHSSCLKEIRYLQRKVLKKAKSALENKKYLANREAFDNAVENIKQALDPSRPSYTPNPDKYHDYERALEAYEELLEEHEEGLRSKKHFKEKN